MTAPLSAWKFMRSPGRFEGGYSMDSRAFMSVLPKRRCCLILSEPLGKSPGFSDLLKDCVATNSTSSLIWRWSCVYRGRRDAHWASAWRRRFRAGDDTDPQPYIICRAWNHFCGVFDGSSDGPKRAAKQSTFIWTYVMRFGEEATPRPMRSGMVTGGRKRLSRGPYSEECLTWNSPGALCKDLKMQYDLSNMISILQDFEHCSRILSKKVLGPTFQSLNVA